MKVDDVTKSQLSINAGSTIEHHTPEEGAACLLHTLWPQNTDLMGIFCVAQGTQSCTLCHPRGVRW